MGWCPRGAHRVPMAWASNIGTISDITGYAAEIEALLGGTAASASAVAPNIDFYRYQISFKLLRA